MSSNDDRKNAKIDAKILTQIDEMRTEYHACTVRALSSVMRLSETAVRYRVDRLRKRGLVGATKIAGSVHLTDEGRAEVGLGQVVVIEPAEPVPCTCGTQELAGALTVVVNDVYHRADGPCYYVPPGQSPDEALAALTGDSSEPAAGAAGGEPGAATPEREVDSSRTT